MPERLRAVVPWAADALAYVELRHKAGGACPLPELFAALRTKHRRLTTRAFHDGLQRLADNRA